MSAIHDLFFGELDPQEHHKNPPPHVVELLFEIEELEDSLMASLKREEKLQLIRLLDAYGEYIANVDVEAFAIGFKVGARLLAEAFVRRE